MVSFLCYHFRLIIVRLNPNFSGCSGFILSVTQSFVHIIAKAVTLFPSEITQFSDQVRIRLICQLIKDISRVIQKLLKYFDSTAISALIIPALLILFKNLDLNVNNS